MSKDNPKNREEAYVHQFRALVKMMMRFALGGNQDGFRAVIEQLKLAIEAYESKSKK